MTGLLFRKLKKPIEPCRPRGYLNRRRLPVRAGRLQNVCWGCPDLVRGCDGGCVRHFSSSASLCCLDFIGFPYQDYEIFSGEPKRRACQARPETSWRDARLASVPEPSVCKLSIELLCWVRVVLVVPPGFLSPGRRVSPVCLLCALARFLSRGWYEDFFIFFSMLVLCALAYIMPAIWIP